MVRQTEIEWRQKKLNGMIKKYLDGYYTDYYMYYDGLIIVFVKELKTKIKKNCCSLQGLECSLDNKSENKKMVVYDFQNMGRDMEL